GRVDRGDIPCRRSVAGPSSRPRLRKAGLSLSRRFVGRVPNEQGGPSRTRPERKLHSGTSIFDADASSETRPEGVEVDRVGRIIRSTAAAAARRNWGCGVEDVVDRPEKLDISVAA